MLITQQWLLQSWLYLVFWSHHWSTIWSEPQWLSQGKTKTEGLMKTMLWPRSLVWSRSMVWMTSKVWPTSTVWPRPQCQQGVGWDQDSKFSSHHLWVSPLPINTTSITKHDQHNQARLAWWSIEHNKQGLSVLTTIECKLAHTTFTSTIHRKVVVPSNFPNIRGKRHKSEIQIHVANEI